MYTIIFSPSELFYKDVKVALKSKPLTNLLLNYNKHNCCLRFSPRDKKHSQLKTFINIKSLLKFLPTVMFSWMEPVFKWLGFSIHPIPALNFFKNIL